MDQKTAEEICEKHLTDQNLSADLHDRVKRHMMALMTHEGYNNPNYLWSLDDFEIGRFLGSGKFGRVYEAVEKKSRHPVAIKTITKREIVENNVERQVLREIEIQTHLKHPNILKLLCWFHDDFRIYMVVEYATEGELYAHLRSSPNGCFSDKVAARYISQVANALDYCHENHVIHRDIKPENLLLTYNNNVLVSDFGWSVHAPSLKRKTMCGTLDYLSPEMVCNETYTTHVDQWCLGILCYEFLVGSPPFESDKTEQTYHKIKNCLVSYPKRMDPDAKDLISKLLVKEGSKRLSLKAVQKHPWIKKNTAN